MPPSPICSEDLTRIAHDGDGIPFYPALIEHPDRIDRVPTTRRDQVLATNLAYLTRRVERLISEHSTNPSLPDVPEVVDLRAKAEELTATGTPVTVRRLCIIADQLGIPYRRTRSVGRPTSYLVSGPQWRRLTTHIA